MSALNSPIGKSVLDAKHGMLGGTVIFSVGRRFLQAVSLVAVVPGYSAGSYGFLITGVSECERTMSFSSLSE